MENKSFKKKKFEDKEKKPADQKNKDLYSPTSDQSNLGHPCLALIYGDSQFP